MLKPGPVRPYTLLRLCEARRPHRPISQRMLTLNLRGLERNGLIMRDVCTSRHTHAKYHLTRSGAECVR